MRRLLLVLSLLLLLVPVPLAAQDTLSQQVLALLARANTWTAAQTFGDLTITGTCTGCGGAGGGTVTSVALDLPTSLFDVTGSPIVGAGTLTATFDTQTANLIFGGPASGAAAAPTFRALVDLDVPDTITIAGTDNVTWTSVNKTGSSLANLATRSATDLTSGTLPDARFPATLPAASGVNLTALNAANLASGIIPDARMPNFTGDATTVEGAVAITLANSGVTAATYGSASLIPRITVDAKGRLTAVTTNAPATANLLSTTYCADCAVDTATRGSFIVGNATNQWDEFTVCPSGEIIVSDGTDFACSTSGAALTALNAGNVASGLLAAARGGTNKALTTAVGQVLYTDADSIEALAAGTLGQCLVSQGAAAPAWDACATLAAHSLLSATHTDTLASAVSRASIIVGNATPAWAELAPSVTGQVPRYNGTDTVWSLDGSAFTGLSATNLSTGTVPLARISGLLDANIGAGAAITWTKLASPAAADTLAWAGRAILSSPANGVLQATDTAGTAFTRLALGGTTTSFPAVERSAAAVSLVLADGSATTGLRAQYVVEANTATKAVGAVESREVYTDSGDADGSIINLPDDPVAGFSIIVAAISGQVITINTGAGETIWLAGTNCGTDITGSDTGATIQIIAVVGGAGGVWHAIASGTWTCV